MRAALILEYVACTSCVRLEERRPRHDVAEGEIAMSCDEATARASELWAGRR